MYKLNDFLNSLSIEKVSKYFNVNYSNGKIEKIGIGRRDGEAWVVQEFDVYEFELDPKVKKILEDEKIDVDEKLKKIKNRIIELYDDKKEMDIKEVDWDKPKWDEKEISEWVDEQLEELKEGKEIQGDIELKELFAKPKISIKSFLDPKKIEDLKKEIKEFNDYHILKTINNFSEEDKSELRNSFTDDEKKKAIENALNNGSIYEASDLADFFGMDQKEAGDIISDALVSNFDWYNEEPIYIVWMYNRNPYIFRGILKKIPIDKKDLEEILYNGYEQAIHDNNFVSDAEKLAKEMGLLDIFKKKFIEKNSSQKISIKSETLYVSEDNTEVKKPIDFNITDDVNSPEEIKTKEGKIYKKVKKEANLDSDLTIKRIELQSIENSSSYIDKIIKEYDNKNIRERIKIIQEIGKLLDTPKRIPELESKLNRIEEKAEYAVRVANQRFPEWEKEFKENNLVFSLPYSEYFGLKDEWINERLQNYINNKNIEGILHLISVFRLNIDIDEFNDLIQKNIENPATAYFYAKLLITQKNKDIKDISDNVIKAIAQDLGAAYSFATFIIESLKRSVEEIPQDLIKAIAQDSKFAYSFSVVLIENPNISIKDIPEDIVKVVAQDPESSYKFAVFSKYNKKDVPEIIIKTVLNSEYKDKYLNFLKQHNLPLPEMSEKKDGK